MAKTKDKKGGGKVGSGGLSAKTFSGLNKKRMESRGTGDFGNKLIMKKGSTAVVQFLGEPDDNKYFKEFEQHSFQEDGKWYYVPCAGDDCPLCESDSDKVSYAGYRFCCLVYNVKEKKVQVLEGPKTLAQLIFFKYEQKSDAFLKRTYEVSKFPTEPVTYGVDRGDDKPTDIKQLRKLDAPDLDAYLQGELKRYYESGSGGKKNPKKSALEDKDDKKSKKGSKSDKSKSKGKKSKK